MKHRYWALVPIVITVTMCLVAVQRERKRWITEATPQISSLHFSGADTGLDDWDSEVFPASKGLVHSKVPNPQRGPFLETIDLFREMANAKTEIPPQLARDETADSGLLRTNATGSEEPMPSCCEPQGTLPATMPYVTDKQDLPPKRKVRFHEVPAI